jgi:hypothetical protein
MLAAKLTQNYKIIIKNNKIKVSKSQKKRILEIGTQFFSINEDISIHGLMSVAF